MNASMQTIGPRRFPITEVVRGWKESSPALFTAAWLLIAAISAYDTYLVHAHKPIILDVESNPMCSALIELDPEHLLYFTVAKTFGTVLVLTILWLLYAWHRRIACMVSTGVTSFQLGLLFYLTCVKLPL